MPKIKFYALTLALGLGLMFIAGEASAFNLVNRWEANWLYLSINPYCEDRNGCRVEITEIGSPTRYIEWFWGQDSGNGYKEIQTTGGMCLEAAT